MKRSIMLKRPIYWIFVSLIIASCAPQENSGLGFQLSPEETLSAILSEESLISPDEVMQIGNNTSEYQLIDLRPQSEFVKGSLEGAINIPTQYLMEPENMERITEQSLTTILYGADQLEANGPWLLLRQLGYDHLKVMQGGYDYVQSSADGNYVAEIARYDYPAIFKMSIEESEASLKAQSPPKRVAPKKVLPPKKKVIEEEEEGGC